MNNCILWKKNNFSVYLCIAAMVIMVLRSKSIMNSAAEALSMCVRSVIPSLFPFIAASNILVGCTDSSTFRFLAKPFGAVFGVSSASAAAVVCGILCGCPVGASCAATLYKRGMISKSEAETLVAFTSNSGAMFVIGTVGCGMLGSQSAGAILYAVHLLSAAFCACIMRPFTVPSKPHCTKNRADSLSITDAVANASVTMLKICGFIVVFAVICEILYPAVCLLPYRMRGCAYAVTELTNGVRNINIYGSSLREKMILSAAALGWSGLSIHMQVMSVAKPAELSLKKFYAARIVGCAFSAILCAVITAVVHIN